jgi:hypothetical protein
MPNNTFEDYKKAVKNKYETEKDNGHSFYLKIPTRGKLRNLCWELFLEQNRNQDDLKVFSSLLGLPFDINRKNKFDEQIDKFRPIETFFKGETDPTNVEAVNMAAILVDFEPRPFNKFRIHNLYKDEIQDHDNNAEIANTERQSIDSSLMLDTFLDEKEKERGIEKGIVEESKEVKESVVEEMKPQPQAINTFVAFQKNPFGKLNRRIKNAIIGVAMVLCIGFPIIFFAFPAKGCMQWTGNNYEIVDCDSKAADNNIELLNSNQIDLKKIEVCDTTTFFRNGKAVVFYARTGNSLECFNQIGYHPERPGQYLKPITIYMKNKYISNKPCK